MAVSFPSGYAICSECATYPYLQLDALLVAKHGLHFEIDAHRRDEGRRERVVRIAKQKAGFANAGVADDQQLEHVVEVLVCGVLLPFRVAAASHLFFFAVCTKQSLFIVIIVI